MNVASRRRATMARTHAHAALVSDPELAATQAMVANRTPMGPLK